MTEAQRRAKNNYKSQIKRIYIELFPTETDLIEHLEKQEAKSTYIKNLIRADIKRSRKTERD